MKCDMILGSSLFLLAIVDFGIQWVAWVFAAGLKTEKFFDLTGSVTFIILVSLSYSCTTFDVFKTIQTVLVIIWAVRLGMFLFLRVLHAREDRRFKAAKSNSSLFFLYWTIQGIWVFITLLPSFFMLQSNGNKDVGFLLYIGWTLWALGFLIEVIADRQKTVFRKDPRNANKFIHTGLWRFSRHPNYFGEMMLWWGLFVASAAYLRDFQWFCAVCPLLDCLLIIFVSGIPILEKDARKKYGADPLYQDYVVNTPVLVPFMKCCKSKREPMIRVQRDSLSDQ